MSKVAEKQPVEIRGRSYVLRQLRSTEYAGFMGATQRYNMAVHDPSIDIVAAVKTMADLAVLAVVSIDGSEEGIAAKVHDGHPHLLLELVREILKVCEVDEETEKKSDSQPSSTP